MKKVSVLVAMVVLGGIAFASSISIPWFVDNSPAEAGWPPRDATQGVTTLVFLKNNTDDVVTCEVAYYTQGGNFVGPIYPNNTFTIAAKSSVAFRPAVNDPDGSVVAGKKGQEGSQGNAVPDRPLTTLPGAQENDGKKNGSISVTWQGGDKDVQGIVATCSSVMSYAHLLPPGF